MVPAYWVGYEIRCSTMQILIHVINYHVCRLLYSPNFWVFMRLYHVISTTYHGIQQLMLFMG